LRGTAGCDGGKSQKGFDIAAFFLLKSAFAFLNPPVLNECSPHWHNRAAKSPIGKLGDKRHRNEARESELLSFERSAQTQRVLGVSPWHAYAK
jgi:hypothetical protein